jgi:ADP-ribose pyrophosphatase YjhB (NUDIX family)
MKGHKDYIAARIEAEQESGVTGKPRKKQIGTFLYWKRRAEHFDLVNVFVYPLEVTATLLTWKEKDERKVRWVDPSDVAGLSRHRPAKARRQPCGRLLSRREVSRGRAAFC